MPAETPPATTDTRQADDPGGERPRPPRPDGVRADRITDAAADQHDGTDTWKQAANAAGTLKATKDMPEPDSLGG
jgi:hypothetical protein